MAASAAREFSNSAAAMLRRRIQIRHRNDTSRAGCQAGLKRVP